MKPNVKVFFDEEFTGLHQATTLVSIGLIASSGETFYCELVDYDKAQLDQWLIDNVIAKLKYALPAEDEDFYYIRTNHFNDSTSDQEGFSITMQGEMKDLKRELTEWFAQFGSVQIWSDCLAYDWVLFNEIFGHAFNIPKNVYYIPFDLCTLFEIKGIDPDISREEYSEMVDGAEKHNALWDAKVIQGCYNKAMGSDLIEMNLG